MVDHAYCFSCGEETPVGGATLVLARRIVIRNRENVEQVLNGESVAQVCPSCQTVGETRQIELKSSMPPFLSVEIAALFRYLEGTAIEREVPGLEILPLGCVICEEAIPLGTRFVYIELSLDTENGSLVDPENKVSVANVCGVCADKTWGVQVERGLLSSICCATKDCPACAPLRIVTSRVYNEMRKRDSAQEKPPLINEPTTENISWLFDELWPLMDRSSAHRDRMIGIHDEISSCFQKWASDPNQLLKALDNLEGVGLVIASGLIFSANRDAMVPFDQYTTGWCLEKNILPDHYISLEENYANYCGRVSDYVQNSSHLDSVLDCVREAASESQFPIRPE